MEWIASVSMVLVLAWIWDKISGEGFWMDFRVINFSCSNVSLSYNWLAILAAPFESEIILSEKVPMGNSESEDMISGRVPRFSSRRRGKGGWEFAVKLSAAAVARRSLWTSYPSSSELNRFRSHKALGASGD